MRAIWSAGQFKNLMHIKMDLFICLKYPMYKFIIFIEVIKQCNKLYINLITKDIENKS